MKKLIALTAVAALLGCAPKVTTSVLMPSKAESVTDFRNVAVLPFSGGYGAQITPSVESTLVTAEVNGMRYFKVADRQNLNRVISEQKLQVSGITDNSTAVKLGRLIGVQGIFTGTAELSTGSTSYTESRTKCAGTDSKGKCISYYDTTVVCTKKRATVTLLPKLIDVSTGQVVYSDRITGEADSSFCQDSGVAPLAESELARDAVNDVLTEFRRQIAPYSVNVSLTLLTEKGGLDGDGKDLLKSSLKFAEAGRMDRACAMWAEGITKYPKSPSMFFNLGLCRETEAKYPEALELYMKADALTDSPDKVIGRGIDRAKERIADSEKLRKQL